MALTASTNTLQSATLSGSAETALGTLNAIPSPRVSPPIFQLSDIAPNDAAFRPGATELTFHAVGDTGGTDVHNIEAVADAMAADFASQTPSFFLHLGDVMYGANKDTGYLDRFYRPYSSYPAPIIAIPGNHDGETKANTDPTSLRAFWANFCTAAPQSPTDVSQTGISRKTMTQPGVYWLFQTPLADIIGLYSNTGENGGTLSDSHGDTSQIEFLGTALGQISTERRNGTRRALILATHHPAYSSSGHSNSLLMLQQIDDACAQAHLYPDLLLAGHAHNYQHYTRVFQFGAASISVPFLVVGTGGYGLQAVSSPTGVTRNVSSSSVTYKQATKAYGYLLVQVTQNQISVTMRVASEGAGQDFDNVLIPLI